MTHCTCPSAPVPFDHLQVINQKCIYHHPEVTLVRAGWERNGGIWTHPTKGGLWTKEQAMGTLSTSESMTTA